MKIVTIQSNYASREKIQFLKNFLYFFRQHFRNEDLLGGTPLSYFREDESTRAWGDELSGELLYTILLKRVRYSKNTNDGLQWETQKVLVYYYLVLSHCFI
jgi:hypothetical protein